MQRRNRLLAVGCGLLSASLMSAPHGLLLVAVPLGYGHLFGAWLFARRRARLIGLDTAFAAVSLLTLLCAYTWALQVEALRFFVLVPMLLLSGWHIAENDLALGRADREQMRLGPIPRDARRHTSALGVTALLGLGALATPDGAFYLQLYFGVAPPFVLTTLPELATAVLMYHAASFVLFSLERARRMPPTAARRLRWRLFQVHALPLAANAFLYCALPSLHSYLAAPTLYLFFSVLHALHTAALRGVEPGHRLRPALAAR